MDDISSRYDGPYSFGLFQGSGTYTFPEDRGKYVGEFSSGQFHGEGVLYVKGGQFQGTWDKGKLLRGGFIFEDGLHHKKVEEDSWAYCSEHDSRFHSEIQIGVPIEGPYPFPTPTPENYDLVPVGFYDALEGYFNPKKSSIFDYKSGEEVRVINQSERDWILKHCRKK